MLTTLFLRTCHTFTRISLNFDDIKNMISTQAVSTDVMNMLRYTLSFIHSMFSRYLPPDTKVIFAVYSVNYVYVPLHHTSALTQITHTHTQICVPAHNPTVLSLLSFFCALGESQCSNEITIATDVTRACNSSFWPV